jgi:hypothetical protein
MKYRFRPNITTTITYTITSTVTSIVTVTTTVTSNCDLTTCHYNQPIEPVTIIDTQPDPVTWIMYEGHISTRYPTSPTHASTKHVPRSPTYYRKICVSTMYQIMYQTINLYHTKHESCMKMCPTKNASTMHQHLYQTMHQPCTITYTKLCINHAPQPIPNHALTMHHNMYHMPQP